MYNVLSETLNRAIPIPLLTYTICSSLFNYMYSAAVKNLNLLLLM